MTGYQRDGNFLRRVRVSAPAIEQVHRQPVQPAPQALLRAAPPGALAPGVEGDFAAVAEVLDEAGRHRLGEVGVERLDIGIEVEAQVPVVEVARCLLYTSRCV